MMKNNKKDILGKVSSFIEKKINIDLNKDQFKKFFKRTKEKVVSFYSTEGDDLDKEIFINSEQKLIKIASSIIILTGFLGIGWLAIAKTDEIVIVPGKIIPIGKVKEIKMPMSGVIEDIQIKEGDLVEKDQILMKIESDTNTNTSTTLENSVVIKRNQIKTFEAQILENQNLNMDNMELLKDKIQIYQKLSDRYEDLYAQGAVSELDFLNQKTRLQSLKSELLQYKMDWTTKTKTQDVQIQDLKNSLNELEGQLKENDLNLINKTIESPVAGYVFDLKPIVPGYSAQMTETIVKIVPMGDLIAYLEIPSSEIGFVKKGMEVEISIDSYPSTDFGVLEGVISTIGTDALEPDPSEQRNQFVYPARVTLQSQNLKIKGGKELKLKVGMSLQGNIKLRKVSYLNLLLTNFKSKTDSLKEL